MPNRIPSPTALRVAALRALHQTVDAPPVFVDPLAERVLGQDSAALLESYQSTAAETARLRGTLAVRTVVAEETIAEARERGIRQCVILGAGLDTFAYRNTCADFHVFEVDRPSTQSWKRDLLRVADIDVPPTVSYVAVNFERDDLFGALVAAGFDRAQPAVFVMLGVVPYVAADKLLETFRRIASDSAQRSEIVFDYTEPLHNAPAAARASYEAVAKRVAAGGEPWITFFEPAPLRAALRDLGFAAVTDIDAAALGHRFCSGRTDGLCVVPLVHLVRARN